MKLTRFLRDLISRGALAWVMDMAFPPTIPCLPLFLAAVSQQRTSWVPESSSWFSTLGFASGHLSMLLLPPPRPPQTPHRMVVPLREHHFQLQVQGPSLCTEVAGHPWPLPLQDRFAFQHSGFLHKQEDKNLAWGTKCHNHAHVIQVVQAREAYVCLRSPCVKWNLRNIDFETDAFLPWHHQFLKNMSFSQQSSFSALRWVCSHSSWWVIPGYPLSVTCWNQVFQSEILSRGREHEGLNCVPSLPNYLVHSHTLSSQLHSQSQSLTANNIMNVNQLHEVPWTISDAFLFPVTQVSPAS